MAELLDDEPLLKPWVGFNLDVAHWRLAGIEHDWVNRHLRVKNRIVHAHLSGHHRAGHFGDIPLLPWGGRPSAMSLTDVHKELQPWLNILHDRMNTPGTDAMPHFSGYVSLELEAAPGPEVVVRGSEDFCRFLRL